MKRFKLSALLVLTLFLAIGMTGCTKNKGLGGQTGAGGPGTGWDGNSAYPNPGEGVYMQDIPLSGRDEGVNFYGANVNRNLFQPVYFAFDSYRISQQEMGKLRQVADHMRRTGDRMILAGHTDAVGTSEYNRNLGELRALAVRSALSGFGVSADRMQTVSYGEDRLADPGNDAANRRVEFGVYR